MHFVPFKSGGAPLELRSGGVAFGASGKHAEHIFAAYNAGSDPIRIEFTESFDGGLTWQAPVVPSGRPMQGGPDQFMPSVASQNDGTILITYYDRSPDPTGSLVRQKVAIRYPGETTWVRRARQLAEGQPSDLALMPHKCGTPSDRRFIGDYHRAVGGKTHVHALRVDALSGVGDPKVRLQASALSGSSWW